MSKTLFNQNTFQSKNVTNSDDVSNLKVDTFKATTLTATTIVNTELQAATAGVATNTSAIATNTTEINDAEANINTNATNIATNTAAITANSSLLTTHSGLIVNNSGNIITNTAAIATNATNIATNTAAIATNTSAIATNATNIATNASNHTSLSALVSTNSGLISTNTTNINSNTVAISAKQDPIIAGTNITIDGDGRTINSTAAGTTYSALTNGGLALNASNQFGVDFSNTNATIAIPQRVTIDSDAAAQLIVQTVSDDNNDAAVTIRGGRSNSTISRNAQIRFENYDKDLDATNDLLEIAGQVSNSTTNTGGMRLSNFADGVTRTRALMMSSQGNFRIGDGAFQDDQKLYVGGSSYITEGLILDPFAMPQTTFSVGTNDGNASTTSRANTYIKFAPSSTVLSDWVYLRNVGTSSNANHLTFDFFDDASDTKFSIRNIKSTVDPDVITPILDVFSDGVTAHTTIYRIPQQVTYYFQNIPGTNSDGNIKWGGVGATGYGIQTSIVSTKNTGAVFTSISSGVITVNENGYYRIRVTGNGQEVGYNNRAAFAVFLRINTTDYFRHDEYNFFSWIYIRNDNNGAHGNLQFEDYHYMSSGTTLQVRHRVDINNRTFDDTLEEDQFKNYQTIEIERIAATNIATIV